MRRSIIVLGVLVTVLAGCGGPEGSPEAEIRAWIDRGEALFAAEDRRGLVDMVSPAYADARGMSRDDIDDRFRILFLRTDDVKLVTNVEEITVMDGSAANVKLTVAAAGRDEFATLGFSADAYNFELELDRAGGAWRLIGARWGEIGDEPR